MTENICLKLPKFWVRFEKLAELGPKSAWVRAKIASELGAQKRKNNPGVATCHDTTVMTIMTVGSEPSETPECHDSVPEVEEVSLFYQHQPYIHFSQVTLWSGSNQEARWPRVSSLHWRHPNHQLHQKGKKFPKRSWLHPGERRTHQWECRSVHFRNWEKGALKAGSLLTNVRLNGFCT